MKSTVVRAALVCAAMTAGMAHATTYTLSAMGTVSGLTLSTGSTYNPSTAPSGLFAVGDAFRLTATFDTDHAALTSLYDADPSINIYYLLGSNISITSGSYVNSFQPRFDFDASLQVWNDNLISNSPVDSQSFEFSNYNYTGPYPFDLSGSFVRSELVSLNAFDSNHVARDNDLISELVPSSNSFTSTSLSYSFGTSDNLGNTNQTVIALVNNVRFTLLPAAVPEPTTWAMMISGFGTIGAAMRRRKLAVRLAS